MYTTVITLTLPLASYFAIHTRTFAYKYVLILIKVLLVLPHVPLFTFPHPPSSPSLPSLTVPSSPPLAVCSCI